MSTSPCASHFSQDADHHSSLQVKHRIENKVEIWRRFVEPAMMNLPGARKVTDRWFYNYISWGTRYAALGRAGSIYFLLGIAAAGKVSSIQKINVSQIQPICEHLMNPSGEFLHVLSLAMF